MVKSQFYKFMKVVGSFFGKLLLLTGAYFLIEVLAMWILQPEELWGLAFCAFWAAFLSGFWLILPRLAGRILFGITYFFMLIWTLAQTAYYSVFSRVMWLSDIVYAGEGAGYVLDVLGAFPAAWWIGGTLLLALGIVLIWKFPKTFKSLLLRLPYGLVALLCVVGLFSLPEIVFLRDNEVWGTHSEYAQSSSYRATYNTMYDAGNVYDICGMYQLTFRDIWVNELYPLTPAYRLAQEKQTDEIDAYFADRGTHEDNEMTGTYEGKNVVLVLMESMDDWMITQEDTPTLYRLMGEGLNFTDFYTPGYGSARTINSEFCINTGIYLPTTGQYVFDYVTNDFGQSIASRATANGYTAEVFHYNTPDFYSRGVFEPAMGYDGYNCYADYETDKNRLYDDELLFDIPELNDLFFREGQTFNTIITRSAHLSYKYNEVLSYYALKKYPQYRGKYASEEEDCARVKAKLVDDLFARLLEELEKNGQLSNTVIIGVTDHYTYGYKNMEELYALSGVKEDLLLEKTPFFVWSQEGPSKTVEKTLSTADFLPTVLNLLGYDSPYSYLGQDAFDPDYEGVAFFPNGSWISDGVVCAAQTGGKVTIVENKKDKPITEEYLAKMAYNSQKFIRISNLLLTSDYYKNIR
jgi:phosphoglycerol transferase MdoB-like AlkP superfamily enzyme